ncbi:Uncharacterised protein [Mycobacteroides abscessus subsp. abscessus]|nr:Uncharacterised protein [Mycobacteroides abscessus subsp. abscessus]
MTDAIRQALKSLEEADRASSNDLRKASASVDAEHNSASTQPAAFMPAGSGGAASGSMKAGSGGFSGGGFHRTDRIGSAQSRELLGARLDDVPQ